MITLKYLVIGIANDLQIFINKTFMDRRSDRIKNDPGIQIIEYGAKTFKLLWIFCKNVKLKFFILPAFQIFYQQIKLAVKCRLLFSMKFYFELIISRRSLVT